MNYNGCKRKFKVKQFESKWSVPGQASLNRTFSSSSAKRKKIKSENGVSLKKRKVVEIPASSVIRRI